MVPQWNREFGWAPRHEKVLGKIPGKPESKFNLIAVLHSAELKALLIEQGTLIQRYLTLIGKNFCYPSSLLEKGQKSSTFIVSKFGNEGKTSVLTSFIGNAALSLTDDYY